MNKSTAAVLAAVSLLGGDMPSLRFRRAPKVYPKHRFGHKERKALRKVRDLIAKGWCKGAFARTAEGVAVTTADKSAASFCLMGAIVASGRLEVTKFVQDEVLALGYSDLADFNDRTSQSQCLALLDRLIDG